MPVVSQDKFNSTVCLNSSVECRVLDHGLVKYIDHMGNDQAVVDAARVSYQEGTKKVRSNDGLINYLARNKHMCYDKDTEVLAKVNGNIDFYKFIDLKNKKNVELAAFNKDTHYINFEVIKEIYEFPFNGELIKFKTKQYIDLVVTPNHNMLFRERKYNSNFMNNKWNHELTTAKAEDIYKNSTMKFITSGKYNFNKSYEKDRNFGQFIGFFIGDGFIGSKNQIHFRLKKERKINYISNILTELSTPFEIIKDKYNVITIKCYIENSKNLYSCFYKDKNKNIPNWVLNQSKEFLEGLLDGLFNSDGSLHRKAICYSTIVEQVANKIQIINLLLNKNITKNKKTKQGMYKLLTKKNKEPVINQGEINYSKIPYNDNVYCSTVSTGFLIVRRNGKVCVSGNSPFEMIEFKFMIKAPIFVARQLVRHRHVSINEESARYSVMSEEFYNPKIWRKQSKKNKQVADEPFDDIDNAYFSSKLKQVDRFAYEVYEELLNADVGREQARMVLPVSLYTSWYCKMNARELIHIIKLRDDPHAQFEVREYMRPLKIIFETIAPITYKALMDYYINPISITKDDIKLKEELEHILLNLASTTDMELVRMDFPEICGLYDKIKALG